MKNYGAFNLRHLAKGLKYNNLKPEELGITVNQVKVLKSWLKLTGLSNGKKLTPLGSLIKAHDRFLEENITMEVMHYKILTYDQDSIWRLVFSLSNFYKQYILKELSGVYEFKSDLIVADLNVLLNMYIPKIAEKESMNRALLPLIRKQGDFYCKREYKPNIWVALAIIIDNLPEPTLDNNASWLEFNTIYSTFKNVFGLEYRTVEDILYKLQNMGFVKIRKSHIEISCNYTFLDCIEKAYKELEV